MAKKKRTESDTLGIKKIDIGNMWGSQTQRAVENFQIGAEKIPIEIIKAIGLQKKAATQANLHFSLINKKVGNSIIKVCNQYKTEQGLIHHFPFDINNESISPKYINVPGWEEDLTQVNSADKLPKNFIDYIQFLERELNTPIKIVSVGPDRKQTIFR